VLPAFWVQEPLGASPCPALPSAAEGVAASPVSDLARSLRTSVIRQAGLSPADASAACGTPVDGEPDRYVRQLTSFGTRYVIEGRFLASGHGELLQVEALAPAEHQATMRQLFDLWVRRLGTAGRTAAADPSSAHR
jgi:hypothetical protein